MDVYNKLDELSDFMRIWIELKAQSCKVQIRKDMKLPYKGWTYFNLPEFSDYNKLNKPLSKNAYNIIGVVKDGVVYAEKMYYNYWKGQKYFIKQL